MAALKSVSLRLETGEILGLIGPNGAGKTTLINVMSGFVRAQEGAVMLGGRTITALSPERRSRLGLARTFQSVRFFARLTVAENIEVATLAAGLRGRAARSRLTEILERLNLAGRANVSAGGLNNSEARRVGIGRALASDPAFLLLDEPAAGASDDETSELAGTLRAIRDDLGPGLLVVEHDMSLIMGLCDRVQVLVEGSTIAVDVPAKIHAHPTVRRAYLGI